MLSHDEFHYSLSNREESYDNYHNNGVSGNDRLVFTRQQNKKGVFKVAQNFPAITPMGIKDVYARLRGETRLLLFARGCLILPVIYPAILWKKYAP